MLLMMIWTKEVQENDDGNIDEMGQFEQRLIQNCNLIAFPTNNDLNICIMGNDPVQSFVIASFTETPTKIYIYKYSYKYPSTKSLDNNPTGEPTIPPYELTKSPSISPTNIPSKTLTTTIETIFHHHIQHIILPHNHHMN
eukprot:22862_1